jgi:cytochrome c oxidase subunit 4
MDKLETAAAMVHGDGEDHVPHVLPLKLYLGVFAALLVLTAVTVWVSYFDFGDLNIVVALGVAMAKASLVAAVFMHLAFDKKFNLVVFLIGVLFLVMFLGFTMADTEYRELADRIEAERARDYTAPFVDGKPDLAGSPAPAGKKAP